MDAFVLQANNIGPRPFGFAQTPTLIPHRLPPWLREGPPSELLRPGPLRAWLRARLIGQPQDRGAFRRAARSGRGPQLPHLVGSIAPQSVGTHER
jgi:hypothetical protein